MNSLNWSSPVNRQMSAAMFGITVILVFGFGKLSVDLVEVLNMDARALGATITLPDVIGVSLQQLSRARTLLQSAPVE
jgi:hypothetical protein